MSALAWVGAVSGALVAAVVVSTVLFHLLTALVRTALVGPAPGLWGATLREVPAFAQIVSWNFRRRRALRGDLDVDAVAEDANVVVVAVHGAAADGTSLRAWASALRAHPALAGVPVVAPDHGNVVDALDVHAGRVGVVVDRLLARAPRARLVFVAHSMGGVVVRHLLASSTAARAATAGIVTVASPHDGTAAVRVVPLPGLLHLGPSSPALMALPALSTLAPHTFVAGSTVDNIVYPLPTSLPAGSSPQVFEGIGHASLLTDPRVAAYVADRVTEVMSRAAAPRT
jgi:hypothetical protein